MKKEFLDIAVYDSSERCRFSNSPHGIKQAIEVFSNLASVLVVFEATGGWEVPLWKVLTEAGIAAVPVNPRQIRDFARVKGRLSKTDKIDAQVIAHYGQASLSVK